MLINVEDLLCETEEHLKCRKGSNEYADIVKSIVPTLKIVEHHVKEFEKLIQFVAIKFNTLSVADRLF